MSECAPLLYRIQIIISFQCKSPVGRPFLHRSRTASSSTATRSPFPYLGKAKMRANFEKGALVLNWSRIWRVGEDIILPFWQFIIYRGYGGSKPRPTGCDNFEMGALSFASLRDGSCAIYGTPSSRGDLAGDRLRWKEYARQGTLLFCLSRIAGGRLPPLRKITIILKYVRRTLVGEGFPLPFVYRGFGRGDLSPTG